MSDPGDNWTDWYDGHAAVMLLLARQRVPSRADAEDIVQDAFVRFWPRRRRVADAKAYLYRCVMRCAADWFRAQQRRRARERAAARSPSQEHEPLFRRHPQAAERQALIEAALSQLPPEQRDVLVLKIWAGLTFAQIARVLDVPQNTAASRYRYAIESLRKDRVEEMIA
jgi:RNA polymerase sigma-70 factor (ECF subfamily)